MYFLCLQGTFLRNIWRHGVTVQNNTVKLSFRPSEPHFPVTFHSPQTFEVVLQETLDDDNFKT
jgi:hypothetical protein